MSLHAKVVLTIAVAVIVVFVFEIGRIAGTARAVRRSAENNASIVFALERAGLRDIGVQHNLISTDTAEMLRQEEAELGRVRSFSHVKTSSGPVGLPLVITLRISRDKGAYDESLIRHGAVSPMMDYWPPKVSGN